METINGIPDTRKPQIFLCYCEEDFERVTDLYERIAANGWRPWLDERDILPGERRKQAVADAIAASDFFLVCVSEHLIRQRGRVQKEIGHALDVLQNLLEDDIYLVPVLLENCPLPDRLREFQPVRLYRETGLDNLWRALNAGLKRRMREDARDGTPGIHLEESPARNGEQPELEFRFYNLLGGAHQGLEHNRPRDTAACLQQCTVVLLRMMFRFAHGDVAARQATVAELTAELKRSVSDSEITGLVRSIIQRCHVVSHDLDEALSRKRAGNLLVEFIAVFFWFQRHVLGKRHVDLPMLGEALSPRTTGPTLSLKKEGFLFADETESGADLSARRPNSPGTPGAHTGRHEKPEQARPIALHQAALESSAHLDAWKKFLANVACFQLRSAFAIPFVEVHKHNEEIELSFITVCQSVTTVLARLEQVQAIIFIGEQTSVAQWCGRYRVVTNCKDYIEVFEMANADPNGNIVQVLPRHSPNPVDPALLTTMQNSSRESVAPEVQQALHNDIDQSTLRAYRDTCRASTGLTQSNIALLADDHDLFLALSYPMDTWRLFLHPLQREITSHSGQIVFIQGGPGTGKTVVLAHRIAHRIRERERSDQNFRIIFLAFTRSVAINMRNMLYKLNVDPGRVLIEDVRGFFARKTRGELGLRFKNRRLTCWELFRGRPEEYLVTDVFFDEFQDFPTRDQNNYIIKMIRAVQTSGATLTCTYDEHQSIYHTETDLEYWDRLLKIDHVKLSYCYRMAKEISEIAYDHRRIMLEHAEDMIRMSTGKTLPLHLQQTVNYAFGGGSICLVPSFGIRQIATTKRIINELRKQYSRDEVVIIFFDPRQYSRRHAVKFAPDWYDNLKSDLQINIYNPFAIKGLEFRAGVVLFPHYCFMNYYTYLRDGVSLRRLDEFCDVIARYHARHVEPLSHLRFQVESEPLDDLVYFLSSAPGLSVRTEAPGLREIIQALAAHGITGALLTEAHEMYNRFLSHDLKSLLVRYDAPGNRQKAGLDAALFARLRESLSANTAKIKKHTRFRRARMIHTEIDSSLRDLNEFYVAITRFREKAFLVYDREYNLADILPGAETLEEQFLFRTIPSETTGSNESPRRTPGSRNL